MSVAASSVASDTGKNNRFKILKHCLEMCKFVCSCLNVQINTKPEPKPLESSATDLIKCHISGCGEFVNLFFSQQLVEATLNLEGIHVAYPRLLVSYNASDWQVNECVNCGDLTHATSAKNVGQVLVFAGLLNDDVGIQKLINSEDYSPVYKIIIRNTTENTPVSVDLMSTELREELQTIQKQLNTFLVSEESSMEERIRLYEQTEREKYAQLQSKARTQKNVMMSRILSAAYKNVTESLSDALDESATGDAVGSFAHSPLGSQITFTAKLSGERFSNGQSLPDQNDGGDDDDFLPPLPRQMVSRSNSSTKRSSENSPVIVSKDFQPGHVPIDDVFQFDPGFQEDPNQPFSDSDDEVVDTDDSSLVDDGASRTAAHDVAVTRRSGDGPTGYSTSVPISVPSWMRGGTDQTQLNQYDDEDDEALPRDAESMAASIKALARSVHGNTSEIFGELPKPPTRARVVSARTARS